jgi:hypothetical protein
MHCPVAFGNNRQDLVIIGKRMRILQRVYEALTLNLHTTSSKCAN